MLADPDVIVVAHRTFPPDSEVCPIRRTEVPECENVRSWIARDRCVPAAHERVTRKHNITSLAADDRFCSREEENIPGHALHGALNQPRWFDSITFARTYDSSPLNVYVAGLAIASLRIAPSLPMN